MSSGAVGVVVVNVLLGVAAAVAAIAGVTYMMAQKIGSAELMTLPAGSGEARRLGKAAREAQEWARASGFEFLGNYLEKATGGLIAAWKHRERPTFFCVYIVQWTKAYDLVTEFAGGVSLTTGSTRSGGMYPRPPGDYGQNFTGLSLDELWGRHIEAENFLIDTGGADLVWMEVVFEESLVGALRKQMEYVRTIPLWPLRATGWFFLRRRKFHNLSIRQQHERGMIQLPKEFAAAGDAT